MFAQQSTGLRLINGEPLQDPTSTFPFHKERSCNKAVSKPRTWRLSETPRRKRGTTLVSYLPRQLRVREQPRVMTEATPFGSAQQLVTLPEGQDELATSNVLRDVRDNAQASDKEASFLTKFGQKFRKNYCPRETPPLILPSAPSDEEKYSYVGMSRRFIISCVGLAVLTMAVGTFLMARASPYYCWFVIYALFTEIWLLASLWMAVSGNRFDVSAHNKLVQDFPITEKGAPTIDIYLPICKEALEVIENAWNHVVALNYPDSRLAVFVLDDGGEKAVQALAERFRFHYICRPNRPELKKAGNLRYAFHQTSGEFFAVFDADFCPRPDFLLETVPYMLADEKHAIVQTPQYFRASPNQTWTEQGGGMVQEYTFRIMNPCRDKWAASLCVGSCAVYRRNALDPIGGTMPVETSEDIHTGFYVLTHGWTIKNICLCLACGVCPDTPSAFFAQQYRWCHGTMHLAISREFWMSNLSVQQKLCYAIGFYDYPSVAIQAFAIHVASPLVLWTRPDLFKYYNFFLAFPSIVVGFFAMKIWARGRYTLSAQYVTILVSYAAFQAFLDLVRGRSMGWKPTGGRGGKAHKNQRYQHMRFLAWAWTITHNVALLSACAYQGATGLGWYNFVPALVINAFNLLVIHRFLLYQHSKD